ncbi:hypothetical protein IGI04_036465 [Brassica rapa subsp. trilocularis]|uniref:RING-type E3 ubiquitin transferase n=1 Tax=Brassica rapa subsp. trilocularis TaxID=1813537 RepID=A0ABQ7LGC8_BRACM|nr:hypothetical protein IGI04_036465 [Brassica rapa subsp. trilocularis]
MYKWLRATETVEGVKVLTAVMELSAKSSGFKQVEEKRQRLRTEKLCEDQNVRKLKQANVELASQAIKIEDLKHKLRERDKETNVMKSSYHLGERELDRINKVSVAVSGFGTKSQLLNQANKIVKRREDEIHSLQRALKEKEEDLDMSIAVKRLELIQ